MNDDGYVTTSAAAGMMTIAQKRLVQDFPFHARFIATWRVIPTNGIATAGVTVRDGVVHILYNPDFIGSCTFPELEGVLVHEINHILFEHIFVDRARFEDEYARMLAEEITVNEWVPGALPGTPITLAQFPELPPNEDTNTRYDRLAAKRAEMSPKTACSVPKMDGDVPKMVGEVPEIGISGPKNIESDPKKKLQPLDDHGLWAEVKETPILSKMAIKVGAAAARDALSSQEWERIPDGIRRQINQVCRGNESGNTTEDLIPGGASIDWGRTLRQYVGRAVDVHPVFHRPSRRFPHLVGIVPGKIRRPQKARVMSVIDTSASIDKRTLERISAELGRMSHTYEVVVVECDAAVRAIYSFAKLITKVHGRGGTDLCPPFHADVLRKVNPDVVVYFTDGQGPAPAQKPRMPVIWCLTPAGTRPASWGKVIRMGT